MLIFLMNDTILATLAGTQLVFKWAKVFIPLILLNCPVYIRAHALPSVY